jgi:Resolvase, N terminal domain
MKPVISYLRVSTNGQGRSGLGLDAQRQAIARFAEAEEFEITAEFVEVETGKGADACRGVRNLPRRLPPRRRSVVPSLSPSWTGFPVMSPSFPG